MKNKGLIITLIIILSILCLLLVGFMITVISGNFGFNGIIGTSSKLTVDREYSESFSKINIDADAGDIQVYSTSDNKVKVTIYDDEDKATVNTAGDTLSVMYKRGKVFGFNFNAKVAKIEIYLPEEYSDDIIISDHYGDIEVDEFLNADVSIDEDAGDVEVKGCKNAEIANNYGDIILGKAETASISQSAGDIKVGTVTKRSVLKNSYGNIKADSLNEYIEIENNCGDIDVKTLNITESSSINDDLGEIRIEATNEIYIDAKTALGDVKVDNNYPKSDVTLKINNSCGDIKVRN